MRDLVRQRVRWSVLAAAMTVSALALAHQRAGLTLAVPVYLNEFAAWAGLAGAIFSVGWMAAVLGAYRIMDGHAAVDAWLERERSETAAAGTMGALLAAIILVAIEEFLLRGVVLAVGGGLAAVAAAGLWRWHGGRRSTIWGMVHALLLTGVALIAGNVFASWLTHQLTEVAWLGYLAIASWRSRPAAAVSGTGSLL